MRTALLFLLLFSAGAMGRVGGGSSSVSSSSSSTSRGPFSVHFGYGMEENKILNASGTEAGYRGNGLIFNLDLRLGKGGPGEFRLFGMAKRSSSTAKLIAENEFNSQVYAGGLKVFTMDWLYFGGGMGVAHQTLKVSGGESSGTNQYYFAQMGVEIPLMETVFIHFLTMAQVNGIKRNNQMTSHSQTDGYGVFLMLTFAPSDTFITNVLN